MLRDSVTDKNKKQTLWGVKLWLTTPLNKQNQALVVLKLRGEAPKFFLQKLEK